MLKKILFFKSVYAITNRHFSNLVIHFFLKLTYTITFFWIITTTNISNKFMIIKKFSTSYQIIILQTHTVQDSLMRI